MYHIVFTGPEQKSSVPCLFLFSYKTQQNLDFNTDENSAYYDSIIRYLQLFFFFLRIS